MAKDTLDSFSIPKIHKRMACKHIVWSYEKFCLMIYTIISIKHINVGCKAMTSNPKKLAMLPTNFSIKMKIRLSKSCNGMQIHWKYKLQFFEQSMERKTVNFGLKV